MSSGPLNDGSSPSTWLPSSGMTCRRSSRCFTPMQSCRCRLIQCGCKGPRDDRTRMLGPGGDCRGSRLLPTEANRRAAYGQYKPDGRGGLHAHGPCWWSRSLVRRFRACTSSSTRAFSAPRTLRPTGFLGLAAEPWVCRGRCAEVLTHRRTRQRWVFFTRHRLYR